MAPVGSSPSSKSLKKQPSFARGKSRNSLLYLLRQEVVQLTRDVQHLARFIGVQRTGFRKLLKKYKKWSKSSELSDRFLPILESPQSFTNQDFTSIFLELSFLYNIIRQAKSGSISKKSIGDNGTLSFLPLSPTESTVDNNSNESRCKFDVEMASSVTQQMTFWVHPDNVVETKVALLKNLGLVSDDDAAIKSSQVDSTENNENSLEDFSYSIYLDNPKKFNSIQTQSEPGQIRWVTDGVSSSPHILCSPVGGLRYFCLASLSDKQSDYILNSQYEALSKLIISNKLNAGLPTSKSNSSSSTSLNNQISSSPNTASPDSKKLSDSSSSVNIASNSSNSLTNLALSWVEKRKAAPISKVGFKRSRFRLVNTSGAASPSSIEPADLWATLDCNINFCKPKSSSFHLNYNPIRSPSQDQEPSDEVELQSFPYCVLEIRWKGMEKPQWLQDLANSHFVYPVEGFSLYRHSVAIFYEEKLSKLPAWLDVLKNGYDIRKAPSKKPSNNNSNNTAASSTTSGPTSPGILLNSTTERDALLKSNPSLKYNATNNEDYFSDKTNQFTNTQTANNVNQQPVVRYWNEFDDPEDGPDDGVFVIIPDDEDDSDGGVFNDVNVARLLLLSDSLLFKLHKLGNKARKLFGLKVNEDDEEYYSRRANYGRMANDEYYYNDNPWDNRPRGLPTIYEDDEDDDEDSYNSGDYEANHTSNGQHTHTQSRLSHRHDLGYIDDEYTSFPLAYGSGYNVTDQRDYLLTILYSLCYLVSTLMMLILFGVGYGEGLFVPHSPNGGGNDKSMAMVAIITAGMVIALGISTLGMALFLIRRTVPKNLSHQFIVYTIFFTTVCIGIGGISMLLS